MQSNNHSTRRSYLTLPGATSLIAVALLWAWTGCGDEASADTTGDYTLVVYDPSGATEITQIHAARLDSLEGRTVCLLSDFMWEADRTMPLIRENLEQSYPRATIVPPQDLPDAYRVDLQQLEDAINTQGCEGVIAGNAG